MAWLWLFFFDRSVGYRLSCEDELSVSSLRDGASVRAPKVEMGLKLPYPDETCSLRLPSKDEEKLAGLSLLLRRMLVGTRFKDEEVLVDESILLGEVMLTALLPV